MATIKCSNCGRSIQDWEKTCLYCNTPNKDYKEKTFGSWDSSFGVGSFGSSFGDSSLSSFGSSFDGPIGSSEFANSAISVSDFCKTNETDSIGSFDEFDKPTKRLSSFFTSSEPVTAPPVTQELHKESPKKIVYSWEKQKSTEDISVTTHYLPSESTIRTASPRSPYHTNKKIENSHVQSTGNTAPGDYRAKLEQYRREHGYGDYARQQNLYSRPVSDRSDSVRSYGEPNSYEKYNKSMGSSTRTSHNKKNGRDNSLSMPMIIAIITVVMFIRFLLSLLFLFS